MRRCARGPIREAMTDSGLSYDGDKDAIGGIWYGNCSQGMLTSQHCVRGQVILRRLKFERMPIVNVENACATGATALNQAVSHILAGVSETGLAVGIEKMLPDLANIGKFPEIEAALPYLGLAAFWVGSEPDRKELYIEHWRKQKSEILGIPFEETTIGGDRSPFMDYYAVKALQNMKKYGYTQEQLARICAKTHHHSTMNPKAQYRKDITWEEVLADKPITYPLTRPMCAPDGRRLRGGDRLLGELPEDPPGDQGPRPDPVLGPCLRPRPRRFRPGYLGTGLRDRLPQGGA